MGKITRRHRLYQKKSLRCGSIKGAARSKKSISLSLRVKQRQENSGGAASSLKLLRSGRLLYMDGQTQEDVREQSKRECMKRLAYTFEEAKTLDNGVEVRKSSIPNAGKGLWSQGSPFRSNDFITEYDGMVISRSSALQLKQTKKDTHCRGLGHHLVIDGLFKPKSGRGGASFANDPRDPEMCNAIFVLKDTEIGVKRDGESTLTRVFLRAIKDIPPHSEIFVSYGKGFWERHDM